VTYATLASNYETRSPTLVAGQGSQPCIGTIGSGVPIEIALAAGAAAMAVTPPPRAETPIADTYLDDVVSPDDHRLFEAAVEGDFEPFDLLVLSRPRQHLYYFLKEIRRLGRAPRAPPIWLFDVFPSVRESVRDHNARCLEFLKSAVERASGRTIVDDDLRAAIARTNRVREARRRVEDARANGRLTGSEALTAHGASAFMTPEAYVAAVDAWLPQVQTANHLNKTGLLVFSSEPMHDLSLHRLLEDGGARVAAEDDPLGARGAVADLSTDRPPMDVLLEACWLGSTSRDVYPPEAAHRWFETNLRRTDVAGVVIHLPPADHKVGWDYPRLAALSQDAGRPHLLLRSDLDTAAGREDAARRSADFIGQLSRRGASDRIAAS
jgi:hypothetical protein